MLSRVLLRVHSPSIFSFTITSSQPCLSLPLIILQPFTDTPSPFLPSASVFPICLLRVCALHLFHPASVFMSFETQVFLPKTAPLFQSLLLTYSCTLVVETAQFFFKCDSVFLFYPYGLSQHYFAAKNLLCFPVIPIPPFSEEVSRLDLSLLPPISFPPASSLFLYKFSRNCEGPVSHVRTKKHINFMF